MSNYSSTFRNVIMLSSCRVCMSEKAECDMFDPTSGNVINHLIMRISEIQITENDGLPSHICNKCLEELKIAVNFRKKCQDTDYTLRRKYNIPSNNSPLHSIVSIKAESLTDELSRSSSHSSHSEPLCYVECEMNVEDTISSNAIDTLSSIPPSKSTRSTTQKIKKLNKKIKAKVKSEESKEPEIKEIVEEGDYSKIITPIKRKVGRPKGSKSNPNKPKKEPKPRINYGSVVVSENGEEEHQCSMCEMSFETLVLLKKHFRKHNDPIYQCEVCKKTFHQNSHLQRHLLIHTDMRPFACHICQKSFREKPHLTRHLSVHTGIKPYQCEICGKNFITTSDLNKHLIIHTGHRPFQCEICGNGYNNKSDLNKHLIRKHDYDKNRFQCQVCELQFNTGKNLRQHLLVHCESETIWTKVR